MLRLVTPSLALSEVQSPLFPPLSKDDAAAPVQVLEEMRMPLATAAGNEGGGLDLFMVRKTIHMSSETWVYSRNMAQLAL